MVLTQRDMINLHEVAETSEEGEKGGATLDELLVGEVNKNLRTVSDVERQITGVESVLKRTVFARGAVEWAISNLLVTAR